MDTGDGLTRLLLTTGPTRTSTRKKAEVLSGDIKRPFCGASDKGQRNRLICQRQLM